MPLADDFYWYKRAQPEPRHDPRHELPNFETVPQAKERQERWRRTLRNGRRKHHPLARRLERCRKGHRCCWWLCPCCRRRYRLWLIGETLRLLGRRQDLLFVTLVPPDLRYPAGKLTTFRPRLMIERVKRQLERAGLTDLVVIGGIDIAYEVDGNDPRSGTWQPHLHLIVSGGSKRDLDRALRHLYPKTDAVARPLHILPVTDPVRQFSYCFKPFFQRRVSYTIDGLPRSRRLPLKGPEERELALFAASLDANDLRLMMGVRQRGCKLVVLSTKRNTVANTGTKQPPKRLLYKATALAGRLKVKKEKATAARVTATR